MATTRKRTSGFTEKKVETKEEVAEVSELLDEVAAVSELLDEVAAEMFETISHIEEQAEEKVEEVAPPAPPIHVLQAIDPAPVKAPPKRHRRNVPRFSDSK